MSHLTGTQLTARHTARCVRADGKMRAMSDYTPTRQKTVYGTNSFGGMHPRTVQLLEDGVMAWSWWNN